MLIVVLAGFIASLFVGLIFKLFKKAAANVVSLVPLALFATLLSYAGEVGKGNTITESWQFLSKYGIEMSFILDGFSLIFSLIITGIGTAVFFYAGKYLKGHTYIQRFYVVMLLFMASMLGTVLSDNLISLFVFWELTSVTSFILIGFDHHKEESRYAALQALLVTASGGLAMLAGFVLIGYETGTYKISALISNPELLAESTMIVPIIILVLLGAFTKSAQFPFHFWLPNAMAAPTPVSAYLHSATMVKAGVYLIARMHPLFSDVSLWNELLIIFGGITMLFTAILALKQNDLKKLLAYTTVSVLGSLVLLTGLNSSYAAKAMIVYLIAHALYKATLFLTAGAIDHQTGTRDIDEISGLRKLLPFTSVAGIAAALSMAGIIPFIGFVGKEAMYEASIQNSITVFSVVFISSALMVAVAFLTGLKPYFGKLKYPLDKPKEAYPAMWAGPVLLALAALVIGLFPQATAGNVINAAHGMIYSLSDGIHIKLWHGFNTVFFLSLLTLIAGIIIYFARNKYYQKFTKFSFYKWFQPSFIYDKSFNGLLNVAKLQTIFFQNGFLRNYLTIIAITLVILGGYTLLNYNRFDLININSDYRYHEIIISVAILLAIAIIMRAKGRLTAVAGMGVVGFSIAVFFVFFGAPDLSMTQFAVETLTVIIFILVIYKLPKFIQFSTLPERIRDFIIASAFGLFMTLTVLFITSVSIDSELKKYFAEASYTEAKGKNIVNVILVDFRALDTMGEITVLAIAAIGVFSLLKLRLITGGEE